MEAEKKSEEAPKTYVDIECEPVLIGVKGKPVKCRRRRLIQPRSNESLENFPLGSPPKRPKLIFTTGERIMIINIFKYVQKTNPLNIFVSSHDLVRKTSEISGVGERSIYRILREYVDYGTVSESTGRRSRVNLIQKLTDKEKSTIKNIILEFRARGETPSLRKILKAVNEDSELPDMKMTTLRRILKHMNFRYVNGQLKLDDDIGPADDKDDNNSSESEDSQSDLSDTEMAEPEKSELEAKPAPTQVKSEPQQLVDGKPIEYPVYFYPEVSIKTEKSDKSDAGSDNEQ